ncbi:MAG TPA: PQQ-binding-like beta-propeller repeat protein [Pontiellaceae bacterium]|mgnify:CR=1 FL=1|nr:PQQ-binding-like beta-propeller repeat protein [Pontiellaceae bacterium]HPR82816.1 PQQ-binding-like beta-propeller repeat protein [Pontiellaceae bacterium]
MGKWMLSLMVAAIAAGGYCNDWPVWRGPDRNGISKETGWNPKNAKKLWTKELGDGYSSVSVKGGRLYTMGLKSGDEKTDTVYCLDAKTGNEIWSYSYSCQPGPYKGPRATPVCDADSVYTLSRDGQLICFDAGSGKVKWKTDVLAGSGSQNIKWGLSSSPVIEEDLILLNAGETGMAVDKNSGKIKWKSEGAASYASPVLFDRNGTRCAAIFSASGLQIVEALTGKKISSFDWETKYKINGADPLVIGDRIFISSGYDHGCAMLDFSSGALKPVWENSLIKAHFGSCVCIDGFIYGVDGQAKGKSVLRCVSAADGSEKWSAPVSFGSLMAADGRLIVLDEDGSLSFVDVSAKKYNEISKLDTGIGPLCWTAPVLANGIIYCRNDKGTLVAIDVSK